MEPHRVNSPAANSQDFTNPQDYIKKSDHDSQISAIQDRLDAIEDRVRDDSSLAASFKAAFENDKNMDAALTNVLCELITKNEVLKNSINKAVSEIDRRWWNHAWKMGLKVIGAVVLVMLGAILQAKLGGGS